MAALIVIRVWRAKRTNFMSQRTEPHPSLPPFLCLSAMITEEGLHCRTDSRIKVEKLQQAESREGERVIEDVAYSGWRLRELKAFCKRDIPDDRRGKGGRVREEEGREKMRNSYTLQEWGNQGSRINYDPPQKVLRCRKRTFPCSVHGRNGRLPTFHVSEATAAASRIRCSRRRDSRQTQCETWEKCAEFAVVPPPPPPARCSVGRTSFASLGVVSDRFSSLTRRRPRRFHRRRRRCQSRPGIRQAGAASVRPVFFTGFKDGRKRPGMGITTEKYPGSPSFLLTGRSCCSLACH